VEKELEKKQEQREAAVPTLTLEPKLLYQLGKKHTELKTKIENGSVMLEEIEDFVHLLKGIRGMEDVASMLNTYTQLYLENKDKRILLPVLELADKRISS